MPGALVALVRAASITAAALTALSLRNLSALRIPPAERGADVSTRSLDPPERSHPRTNPVEVSVLLPVRDEAARVQACLRALLAQDALARAGGTSDGPVEVLVLDDGSTDRTVDVVAQIVGGAPQVRVLTGADLPDGWLGKPHACAQLAAAASGRILVFLDADVVLAEGGLKAAVACLGDLDLVSPYPRQEAPFLLARLVQPLLQWSWLTFVPLRLAERSARPSLAVANGQLLVCRAAAYRLAGGHAVVRDAVLEDVALARAFKRAGLRVGLADGTRIAICRMYDTPHELVDGYAKSLWAALGSRPGAVFVGTLLAWLYLLPPAAAIVGVARRDPRLVRAGAAGWAFAAAGRAACARRTGSPAADAVGHPLSIAAFLVLLCRSWLGHRRGTLTWRGRPVA